MPIIYNATVQDLDTSVNEYLIYLTHIQQSVTLSVKEKIEAFNAADSLANDINAITAKVLSQKINNFNQNDIYLLIDKNLLPINRKLKEEMEYYDKRLKLNEKIYYSMKEAVGLLTNNKGNQIALTPDKLNRMLSYQQLLVDKDKEEKLQKELDKTIKKQEQTFDALRLKTFHEMIRGVNHKNEDYFYKTNNYVISTFLSELRIADGNDKTIDASLFLLESDKDIHLWIKRAALLIDYTINTKTAGDWATLSILGSIRHDDSNVDFFIEETFDKSAMNAYLNAFSITPIIKRWNECYLKYYTKEAQGIAEEQVAKDHIDDFLSGKIG